MENVHSYLGLMYRQLHFATCPLTIMDERKKTKQHHYELELLSALRLGIGELESLKRSSHFLIPLS